MKTNLYFFIIICIFSISCAHTNNNKIIKKSNPETSIINISYLLKNTEINEAVNNSLLFLKTFPGRKADLKKLLNSNKNLIFQQGYYEYKSNEISESKKTFDFLQNLYPDWEEIYLILNQINWTYYSTISVPQFEKTNYLLNKKLATNLLKLKKYTKAEFYALPLYFINPKDIDNINLLIETFTKNNSTENFDKLVYVLEKSKNFGIVDKNLMFTLAHIYSDKFEYKKAFKLFSQIFNLYEGNLSTKDLRSIGHTALSANEYKFAKKVFQKIIMRNKKDYDAWENLAKTYTLLGDTLSAYNCYKKIKKY